MSDVDDNGWVCRTYLNKDISRENISILPKGEFQYFTKDIKERNY